MIELYVGIDGGGTKTRIRIEDAQGKQLAETVGGPGNINLYPEQAWQNINQALQAALLACGQQHIAVEQLNVAAGLAGCELENARQAFRHLLPSFKCFELTSDSYIACLGAHAGNDGAIAIIGTGSVALKISHNTITKVGGWGFPYGDEGSAAWLGWRTLQAALQVYDKRLALNSSLIQTVIEQYGVTGEAICGWIRTVTSADFAKLAPVVYEHAQAGDTFADNLLQEAAQHITNLIDTLDLPANNLTCALIGGAVPIVEPYLTNRIKSLLVKPLFDPCYGALSLVRPKFSLN